MKKKQMKNLSIIALMFAIVIFVGCTPKNETNIVNENTETNKNTSMLNKKNQNANMLNRTNENKMNTNIGDETVKGDETAKGEYLDKDNTAQNVEDLNRDVVAKTDKIEAEINKLNDVTDSKVIVSDGKAVVGLKVKDGMEQQTENIKTEVETAVKKIDSSIKTVVVSMEESDYGRINSMEQRLRNGSRIDDMKDDFDDFVNRITT